MSIPSQATVTELIALQPTLTFVDVRSIPLHKRRSSFVSVKAYRELAPTCRLNTMECRVLGFIFRFYDLIGSTNLKWRPGRNKTLHAVQDSGRGAYIPLEFIAVQHHRARTDILGSLSHGGTLG
ncbi:unnamed protein product [Somion occarium]|uniref:Uncharacterized protein n=1 Tax=Somion occarium TaxID=3059160 RepID=A0ABP1CES8_9APHY